MRFLLSTFVSLISVATFAQTTPTTTVTLPPAPAAVAPAAQGDSVIKIKDVSGNKQFADDKEITDAKMKADAGSLSKYSLSFSLSYYGPTFGELDAKDQPNPDGSRGTYETAISGSLGGRYRIDSTQTISVGSGLRAVHPFHGMERVDLNNPFLSYGIVKRFGNLQMRQSGGVSYITVPNYKVIGEYGSLSYDLATVYNIKTSPYAIGLDLSLSYFLYDRDYIASDRSASRNSVALYPNFKYNFSDKTSMNTSLNISFANPRSRADEWALLPKTISQRLGVGYAYTRDIYLSPYVNFFPDKLSLDRTTINFSTVFSLL